MAATTQVLDERNLYFDVWGRNDRRPVVALAAPSAARQLLNSQDWTGKSGQLAIESVKLQLKTYEENTQKASQPRPVTTLFDATAQKIGHLIEDDPSNMEAVTELYNPAFARASWSWPSLPYSVVCSLQSHYHSSEPESKCVHREGDRETKDVDSWILQNEDYLRQRLIKGNHNWTFGLVSLDNCNDVFSRSSVTGMSREITRGTVDGFMCLDKRRAPTIHVQPNNAKYKERFHEITSGQLDGLDWSNVFVAGGIALGALLSVNVPDAAQSSDPWLSSDIDIYIYGLDPVQANKKIEHLWSIFKKNLPEDAPTLVVRNSKTVSFISKYPLRRFQIIQKIVRSPAEVLLNFDLDICAMGFDGEGLYMLPRAARALETGYNVFTMDMVQGHYLGTRRASQQQRVFKYANRGYGIRFLPRYVEALKNTNPNDLLPEAGGQNPWSQPRVETPPPSLDLDTKVVKARDYTDRLIQVYLNWSDNGRTLKTNYVDGWRGGNWNGSPIKPNTDKPIFTHALLDTRDQKTSEPLRRSCLTGFELFYRHVALWEAEQAGRIYVQADVWASTTYEDVMCRTSYEELPMYAWDESFSTEDFHRRINRFNEEEDRSFKETLQFTDGDDQVLKKQCHVQRIVSGVTLEEVQAQDITIPIWMPQDFVEYAQQLIDDVSKEHKGMEIGEVLKVVYTNSNSDHAVPLVLGVFRLSPVTVYQQFDRRLDEVYEAVWSFMHSNSVLEAGDRERTKALRLQLSRRALRQRPEDEYKDFACWVRRDPGGIAGQSYGAMGQGFWWEFEGEDEDNEDE